MKSLFRNLAISVSVIILLGLASIRYLYGNVPGSFNHALNDISHITKLIAQDTAASVDYTINRRKYRLTMTNTPPKLITRVEIYRGFPTEPVNDVRYERYRFDNAELVVEQEVDNSGKVEFLLKPGRYTVHSRLNQEYAHSLYGGLNSAVSIDQRIYLHQDTEIEPDIRNY